MLICVVSCTDPGHAIDLDGIGARGLLFAVERSDLDGIRERMLAAIGDGPPLVRLPDSTALLAPGHVVLE